MKGNENAAFQHHQYLIRYIVQSALDIYFRYCIPLVVYLIVFSNVYKYMRGYMRGRYIVCLIKIINYSLCYIKQIAISDVHRNTYYIYKYDDNGVLF